jgi:plastocyanin
MRGLLTVRSDAPLLPPKAPVTAAVVSIEGFAFSPQTLTIRAGSTVVWTNRDPAPHTVTADDGTFDSGILQSGATFRQTFLKPGTYRYTCTIHPSMKGVVEVMAP